MVFKPPLFTTPSYLMHLGINHQRKYFRSWSNSKKKHGIIGLKGSSSNYHNGSWICEIICSSDIFCFKVQFNLSASSRFSKSTNVHYSVFTAGYTGEQGNTCTAVACNKRCIFWILWLTDHYFYVRFKSWFSKRF